MSQLIICFVVDCRFRYETHLDINHYIVHLGDIGISLGIKQIKINKENGIKHAIVMLFLVTFAMPAGKKKEPLPGPSRCV